MKISYSWLKNYVITDLGPEEVGKLLTDCGLEVEGIEKFETVKGGLEGMVIGEVMSKEKHPDADRLNITTVDIGTGTLLNIVCGASNVEAGQKVVIATIGAKLYPATGEPFEIKKSKIRGATSEGMICAEDEIGLGTSHAGIMVLNPEIKVGTLAKDYFKIEEDFIFEIGLTPNRADAASHVGVARDLLAVLNAKATEEEQLSLQLPDVSAFTIGNTHSKIDVVVEDVIACPRYSGLSISNVRVEESPEWLKNRLKAIGLRPINNIVDVTNFVLHELGQPMHAFDADKIKGSKVIVKKLSDGTKFITLDGTERELSSEDLMICDEDGGMCIAGVFGGSKSGVTESTTNIFLESAYFNSTSVRKSSRKHGLKTDASFRYERGADPNMTITALKRAAILITAITGGEVSSEIIDVYPAAIENFKVPFSFERCFCFIGKELDKDLVKKILVSLDIQIENEGNDALLLSVPPFKVDVQREQDVIEEVLRIYGYNNIEIPTALNASLSYAEKPDKERIRNVISDQLSSNGFSEIMCLSLTKSEYAAQLSTLDPEKSVKMMNPLSSDLNGLRQTMLFSGLETIAYNQNRKNADLKLYEFGKTYGMIKGEETRFIETSHLSIFVTGDKTEETWSGKSKQVDFYFLKGIVSALLERLGIQGIKTAEYSGDVFSQGMCFNWNKRKLVELGSVSRSILKNMDIRNEVFYADVNWDLLLEAVKKTTVMYTEVPKFPEVRRDLALLIDKAVQFEQLEQLAYQAEKQLLKSVHLFDIYEGDKLPSGKKSYALSFILQDDAATLTDKQIEKIMDKLMKTYKEKTGAEIR
ncbi:MAG: phenylalanine--tRNA ligase subunit beta [Bacteroidota bacterium]|nr:phenylalanine--tRNA ligase subunit beta [Bacteroidota bacterium]